MQVRGLLFFIGVLALRFLPHCEGADAGRIWGRQVWVGFHPLMIRGGEWLHEQYESGLAAILQFACVESLPGIVYEKRGRAVREMPCGWTDHGWR